MKSLQTSPGFPPKPILRHVASASDGSSDPHGATSATGCETFSCSCRRANGASGPTKVPLAEATKPQLEHWDLREVWKNNHDPWCSKYRLRRCLNPKNQHQVQSQKVFGAIGDWIIDHWDDFLKGISGRNLAFWSLWWGWFNENLGFNHTEPFQEPIYWRCPPCIKSM